VECAEIQTPCQTPTNTFVLRPFFQDYQSELLPEEIEDNRQTHIPSGWSHSIRTNQRPTSNIPHFHTGCPFCRNRPTLSWLGTGTKYTGLHTQWHGYILPVTTYKTRTWADAQRDGCPAECRWRPLQKFSNSISCTLPQFG